MDKAHRATRMIHGGRIDLSSAVPLTTPIYESSTFVFDSAEDLVAYNEGRSSKYLYSRYENPTVKSVEATLAALDDAECALLFASGMAATATTVMALTKAGDEVVCGAAIYGGTLHLLADLMAKFGLSTRFVSLEELADAERVLTDRTRLLWFESPINPTLRCVDIAGVARACRARGVLSVIDNTFASPINQQPLALGVDVSMQSATKYLNGHSDVTAGVVTGSATALEAIGRTRRLLGTVLAPTAAYSLGRGVKTLGVRMARHNENARCVAEFLSSHPRVERVLYPGLPSHPDHDIARRQMSGFGGVVCLDLGDSLSRAVHVYDRLRVIRRAASLGGVESIVSQPVLTSHRGHSEAQLKAAGITQGMLRISVGLEDPRDLIADLDQALAAS